jgi:hypothetical protein
MRHAEDYGHPAATWRLDEVLRMNERGRWTMSPDTPERLRTGVEEGRTP